jgi:hypothetical protein
LEDTNLIVDDEYCCRRSSIDLIIIRHCRCCRGSTHADDTGRQRRQHGRKTRVVVVIPTPAAPTEEDLRRRIIVAIAVFVQPDGNAGRAMSNEYRMSWQPTTSSINSSINTQHSTLNSVLSTLKVTSRHFINHFSSRHFVVLPAIS